MADKVIGLTFISIGSISFITRYIVGAIITSIGGSYSRDFYYSKVFEFGGILLIFSIICWIIGVVFIYNEIKK